ncbi:hypothetical protein Pyn_05736 [Prunus yedoensis var. nudiflora]|uniref:Uncharacterized protein n=2 Tax=Prunus TaxID=3754 RepID=A0A314YCJ5_PRUYE|nr:hypothetical protein L3X38_000165 [Prunus dulcis]PQQ02008.1 hypothetical protein Pyn_05736 [Prunus yedoensis var. nudiflora]
MPLKGEMLPEEEEIRLESPEMFQEGVPWEEENSEKEKEKKKIEWIIPNLPPPPSHEPFKMAAAGWIVVLPFL